MSPALRETFLGEVKAYLPAFLSSETRERADPVAATSDLLDLPAAALSRALAVHLLLSEETRAFVSDLPNGIRRPVTQSIRPRVAGRTVTSGIDWAATVRHQATANPAGGEWVTRPANRMFDLPENQALAWVLATLQDRAQVAVPGDERALPAWAQEIRDAEARIRASRRTAWLEAVPAQWPGDTVYERLAADRLGFYRTRVTNTARQLRAVLNNPSPQTQVEALCNRFFEPTQDWKLFEIGVLMRLCCELDEVGERVRRRATFDARQFSHYRLPNGREVRIWYQAWPDTKDASELREAATHYGVKATNRPDITVQLLKHGKTVSTVVLELKASSASEYLGSGFSQLLGYLRDRPTYTNGPASGWLVAPPEGGYVTRPPEGRALWVVSSDDVASSIAAAALAL
jgi:hypothetical protein